MDFQLFEKAISSPRINRYLVACNYEMELAMSLYYANLRLSSSLFSIISLFEISLRNQIDSHYKSIFGPNWLQSQAHRGGFLDAKGCESSREKVLTAIKELKGYPYHDKIIAELNFGFWRFLFAPNEYGAAGKNLLAIFPNRPLGVSNKDILNDLREINQTRNRIAHHEPICFGLGNRISTAYPEWVYCTILDHFEWLGFPPKKLLNQLPTFHPEVEFLKRLYQQTIPSFI